MKNKGNLILSILFLFTITVSAQEKDTGPKVILITLDGLRWQELFTGADEKLVEHKKYVHHTKELKEKFWKKTAEDRRQVLFPFIWGTVDKIGQIHGNRALGSKMDLTNKHLFSYPGYNEILTGIADDKRIDSNKKVPNPNVTVLEMANKTELYKGKVAAFGSWDVFPSIVNEQRSGVPVNAGYEDAKGDNLTPEEILLNKMQKTIPEEWGSVRFDAFTHNYALEQMKKTHPNLIYISYGETDDFAHDGNYEKYLKSAETTDGLIKELWDFVNKDEFYRGNTTFIITTDHGRGTAPLDTWRSHGEDVNGAKEVWLIAFGNKIMAKGEITKAEQIYTNQVAASVAKILNIKMSNKGAGKPFSFIK